MSKNLYRLLGVAAFVAMAVLALGLISPQGTTVNAQVKTEICDNRVDDDDDKLVDCDDPDCKCEPPKGEPCSPGYWKNHLDDFNATCVQVSGWTCADLLTAITCRGNEPGCTGTRRQAAASALNAVNGCTE